MSEPQRLQLMKSKRDAAIDLLSLGVFSAMVYFVMNPDKYDRLTDAVNNRVNKMSHWLGVMQTKLSIRSLPETDVDE